MKMLIVYGTTKGYTAKIAGKIAQIIGDGGDEADVVDGRAVPPDLALADYAGIIVGASVIAGRFQSYIVDFIKAHRDEMRQMPSAFFSVSLTESDPDPQRHSRAMRTVSRTLEETGWQPDAVASFAGSIAYLRYRWLMRFIWRRLPLPDPRGPGRLGGLTDDDYALTDWHAVTQFAQAFATAVHTAQATMMPV